MKKTSITRLMTIISSFVLLMGILPQFSVSAAYENTHVNTGNQREDIVTVAETQIGYQEGANNDTKYNRWNGTISGYPVGGYGYPWCHCFVSWCANQADISTDIIPRTAGTSTGRSFFVNQGTYKQSAANGGSYVPQRGDIIYYGSGSSPSHVGIVSNCDGSTVYTIEGNYSDKVGTRAISLSNSYIIGYGVPNYNIPDFHESPSYSILSANCYSIPVNGEITFYASSDRATGYTIGIDNATSRYISQEMPGGQLTLTFTESGNYGAYVTSYNSYGYCDSSWISFSVYDSKPTTSKLIADKTAITVGDTINFTASSDDPVKGFTIGIDNSEGRYITQGMPDGKLTITFDEPGKYGAYVTSYNDFGYSDSEWITFSVYDSKPSISVLSSDIKFAYVGQEISFIASSDTATEFWIGIDLNGERIATENMKNGLLTKSFSVPGIYSAYVTSSNKYGGVDSKLIYFTIYDSAPTKSELSVSSTKAVVNEPLSFFAESDVATTFWIGIDLNDERVATENMQDGILTKSFSVPGKYWAYVTSSNEYGGKDSKRISFTIYSSEEEMIYNGDCNDDGDFNISDVVLLQKWLLAVSDTHLDNWQAVDLCKDNRLDVFDLCLMKHKLIYG